MKNYLLVFVSFALVISHAFAQIDSKSVKFSKLPKGFEFSKTPKTFVLTDSQKNELYRIDSLESIGDMPFRFGKDFSTDIDIIREGKVIGLKDSVKLYYEIYSPSAYSINLIFDKIVLDDNVELNIFNASQSFIYGPITNKSIPKNGVLWTDIIKGDHIIIELTQKGSAISTANKLHISSVIYGYRNTFKTADGDPTPTVYGSAFGCNNDITCPVGNNWRQEADAVAMILLSNGTRLCTGSLLNNTLQNYTPYFLTAFHCLDLDNTGSLSSSEQAAPNNWAFRFRYESPNCGGPDGACYVTFNGSDFKTGYYQTDFTLLQLYSQPTVNYGISYLGWDKNQVNPSSGTLIHHPAGDVKKISFDNDQIFVYNYSINWNGGTTSPAGTHLLTGMDNGTFQGGSSGSPFFDQNHRVFGQLHGGQVQCAPTNGFIGSFYISWNALGLGTWLDPIGSGASTTNTIYSRISGPNLVCNQSQFSLENSGSGGASIMWSSSNSSILSISSSGLATRLGNGSVTISADLTFCDGRTLHYDKVVGVGTPQVYNFTVNSQSYNPSTNGYTCVGNNLSLSADIALNSQVGSYYWSITSGNSSNAYLSGFGNSASFTPYTSGYFAIELQLTNSCGTSYNSLSFNVYDCFARYKVQPNPARDYLTVDFESVDKADALPDMIELLSEVSTRPVRSIDVQEAFKRKSFKNGNQVEIDVKDLPRGVYYLHIKNGRREDKKIDVIRILLE